MSLLSPKEELEGVSDGNCRSCRKVASKLTAQCAIEQLSLAAPYTFLTNAPIEEGFELAESLVWQARHLRVSNHAIVLGEQPVRVLEEGVEAS